MTRTPLELEKYFVPDAHQRKNSDDTDCSYKSFDGWMAKNERQLEEGVPQTKLVRSCKPTYTVEQLSSPLKRWKRIMNRGESPKQSRRWQKQRDDVKYRRRNVPSKELTGRSPEYFEPWYWKGTTPVHRYDTRYHDEEDSENGIWGTLISLLLVIVVTICVVMLIMNKDKVQEWLNMRRFSGYDLDNVQVKVEGDVKHMIGSHFDDMPWKHDDHDEDKSFEAAVAQNDPSVIEHIKNFERRLKGRPGKIFPTGKKT